MSSKRKHGSKKKPNRRHRGHKRGHARRQEGKDGCVKPAEDVCVCGPEPQTDEPAASLDAAPASPARLMLSQQSVSSDATEDRMSILETQLADTRSLTARAHHESKELKLTLVQEKKQEEDLKKSLVEQREANDVLEHQLMQAQDELQRFLLTCQEETSRCQREKTLADEAASQPESQIEALESQLLDLERAAAAAPDEVRHVGESLTGEESQQHLEKSLDAQTMDSEGFQTALTQLEERLQLESACWQEEKSSLEKELVLNAEAASHTEKEIEARQTSVLEYERSAVEAAAASQKLEKLVEEERKKQQQVERRVAEQREASTQTRAALMQVEDSLMTQQLQWHQEKASLMKSILDLQQTLVTRGEMMEREKQARMDQLAGLEQQVEDASKKKPSLWRRFCRLFTKSARRI